MAAPGLVIFDCDGVLVDSERIAVRIEVDALRGLGMDLTERDVIARFVGRPPAVLRAAVAEHVGHPLSADWWRELRRRYDAAFAAELRPVDGIEEALARITLPVCVASSSDPEPLRRKLVMTGLYDRFAGRIFSAAQVDHGKPAPDLFLLAARTLGAAPADCVVVEDSVAGVEAARAAGMDVIAYTGSVTPGSALAGPRTTLLHDMRRLPELLTPGSVRVDG